MAHLYRHPELCLTKLLSLPALQKLDELRSRAGPRYVSVSRITSWKVLESMGIVARDHHHGDRLDSRLGAGNVQRWGGEWHDEIRDTVGFLCEKSDWLHIERVENILVELFKFVPRTVQLPCIVGEQQHRIGNGEVS